MRSGVLLDSAQDECLRRDGVVVARVLRDDQVASCLDLWRSLARADDHGFTVDYMRPERANMREIARGAADLWQDVLPQVFTDHRAVMTTFVVKQPGEESEMLLHEDRSYVDERLHRAYTMWIPLVDVTLARGNGVLEVVPRSHLLAVGMAGSLTPDPLRAYEAHLRSHLVPLDVAAGQAVIYDTRMLHASRPNLSDAPRPAIVCALVPRSADLIHVVATGRSGRRVHAIDERFFVEHHPRDVEAEMPAEYPVVRQYRETAWPDAKQIAQVLGSPQAPGVETVVPHDLLANGGRTPEHLAVGGLAEDGPDLVLEVDDGPPTTCALVGPTGEVRARGVQRSARRRGAPIDLDLGLWRRGLSVLHADLVVMEPGARVALEPPRRRWMRWELQVLESPGCGAGVLSAGAAANPSRGQRVGLRASDRATLWNDGPGQFTVVVIGRLSFDGRHRRR